MNTKQIREQLKSVFPSKKWALRVDTMSTAQVQAIYLRLKRQNKL